MPKLFFAVTNDLTYDQRMHRICGSLAHAGYEVVLIGRRLKISLPVKNQGFTCVRLPCWFKRGFLFYAEYNFRLFTFLLFQKMDGICAIDLDTILPCYLISRFRGVKRIYDAHELFCEMKEIVSRPGIYRFWKRIEKAMVPHYLHGYTVNDLIAEEFMSMYGLNYKIIRNVPLRKELIPMPREGFILYQGALNEGRCFETLIPAMKKITGQLLICGEGNFSKKAQALVKQNSLDSKVIFEGLVPPDELLKYTCRARIGLTLFEKESRSNYYSLANRFFDYLQAGTPQICVDYPVYREINKKFEVAVLISETDEHSIAVALEKLLTDNALWQRLHLNCLKAREEYNWQKEEKALLAFYQNIFQ